MTIGAKLFEKMDSFGGVTAIQLGEKQISYCALNKRSLQVASLIEKKKFLSKPIGIIGQRNFSAYIGIVASVYSGQTYIPINIKYTPNTILKIIKDSGIELLIGDYVSLKKLKDVIRFSGISAVLVPEEKVLEKEMFGSATSIFDQNDVDHCVANTPLVTTKNEVLYILYTSGTTGNPKGVMVTNENVDIFLKNTKSFYDLEIGFRASQTFDLSFDASVVDTYFTLMNGGQICILSEAEVVMPYEYIKREKLNVWYSVPTLANLMFKMGYLTPNSFPALKYSFFGGEPMPQKLADAWRLAAPNSTVENVYGPTEATVNISRFNYTEQHSGRNFKNDILAIGTTFKEHSFCILDNNYSKVKDGIVGELAFTGPQITNGYLKDIEKTEKSFQNFKWDTEKRKWYLTGDLAFVNSFNEIECLGRKDNQIKLAGRRVELGEIENALLKSTLLKDIIVVPKKDDHGKVSALVAFTTSILNDDEKNKISKDALSHIEKLFLPKKIIHIAAFPIMSSGKTDRKKLTELAEKNKF